MSLSKCCNSHIDKEGRGIAAALFVVYGVWLT